MGKIVSTGDVRALRATVDALDPQALEPTAGEPCRSARNRPEGSDRTLLPPRGHRSGAASRTSAPTSKCPRPMPGPIQARSDRGGTASACTVASMTPAARPRQPACAAATPDAGLVREQDGRQSAVRMAHTRPGRRVTAASADPASDQRARRDRRTRVPCTCDSHIGSAGTPAAARKRRRFSATATGTSPTCPPRLNDAKGTGAHAARPASVESARTLGGAGHSGVSQSSDISGPAADAAQRRWPRASARSASSNARNQREPAPRTQAARRSAGDRRPEPPRAAPAAEARNASMSCIAGATRPRQTRPP